MKANNFEQILNKAQLKKTEVRLLLLDFLSKTKTPLSANTIFEKLKKNKLDQVTIYRTLDSFLEKGLIKKVDTGKREAEYELIDEHDDHHHMICIKCNTVEDFTGCDSEKLVLNALKKSKKFQKITHHSFDLFGICESCERK
ncbi:MAG: transcriptional repressor [Candidatus Pacebacteria bacterium]|nr:transcriptional repressor [Candidatus Paceibacterota bacterium]